MLVPKLRFKREDGTDYPEWRYARADEIAEINPKTSDLPNRFYYMDLGSVSRGVWQEKTITDKDNAPSRANRLASVGDVFFQSVRPYNMGHFFFEEEYEYPVVASTGFIQLRATQEYYNGFIYQLLYEDRFNAEVNIRCTGSNYPAINSENFSDIEMLFPCLEEQQKIADFLSTVDEVIAQSEAEVQNLEQQKKAAMQKIFSQEVRGKREDGTEYPEWEDCILSDYCKELKSSIDPKKYPQDSFLEYSMPAFDMDKKPSSVIGNDMNSNRKIVNCPCVLINKLNVRKKRIWKIVNPTNNSVCSAEFIPVTSDKMSIDFLEHLALSDRFTARLLDCSTGTSNSQKRVTPDIIMDMPVSIPCLEEQQKIADFLSAYDEAISYAKQELDKWKELKKSLLQQMFV